MTTRLVNRSSPVWITGWNTLFFICASDARFTNSNVCFILKDQSGSISVRAFNLIIFIPQIPSTLPPIFPPLTLAGTGPVLGMTCLDPHPWPCGDESSQRSWWCPRPDRVRSSELVPNVRGRGERHPGAGAQRGLPGVGGPSSRRHGRENRAADSQTVLLGSGKTANKLHDPGVREVGKASC